MANSKSKDPYRELKVNELLTVALELVGFEFDKEKCIFIKWKVTDDKTIPIPIQTIKDLIELFSDGNYQLSISGLKIVGVESNTIEVPYVLFEITVVDNKVEKIASYYDEESIFLEQVEGDVRLDQALHHRWEKVKDNLHKALNFLLLINDIQRFIRMFLEEITR